MNYRKYIIFILVIAFIYILLSVIIYRGNLFPKHYFSYENKKEYAKKMQL